MPADHSRPHKWVRTHTTLICKVKFSGSILQPSVSSLTPTSARRVGRSFLTGRTHVCELGPEVLRKDLLGYVAI